MSEYRTLLGDSGKVEDATTQQSMQAARRNSYSQFGEDAIVAEYFGDHVGTLVEIGAFHPTEMSNSRLLIERGWNAVLVDCSPRAVRDLLLEYGRHERVKVVQAAVAPHEYGIVDLEVTDDALTTSDPATRKKWDGFGYYGALKAGAIPIDAAVSIQVLPGAVPVFVSIDTEGTSIALAMALIQLETDRGLNACVKVVCVEHDDKWGDFLHFARPHGYEKLAVNGTNIIIARPK